MNPIFIFNLKKLFCQREDETSEIGTGRACLYSSIIFMMVIVIFTKLFLNKRTVAIE